MEFCEKCGGLMVPQKKGNNTVLLCRRCGKEKRAGIKTSGFKIGSIVSKKKNDVVVVSKKENEEPLPKTTINCPKCEHKEAYWWLQQTRAADEAPTRFYKCVKCKHTWREYE